VPSQPDISCATDTTHLSLPDQRIAAVSFLSVNEGELRQLVGKKQRRSTAEAIAAVPECEPRIILATGSYIGEGFDDARLDTLFLAMPISWKGTLQQYVGRLHRLHDAKRVVRVYDYVDSNVLMLARMYVRRLKGYNLIGYTIRDASNETSFFQQVQDRSPKEPLINGET
jgi:superfamily II DNA or RNA helicase